VSRGAELGIGYPVPADVQRAWLQGSGIPHQKSAVLSSGDNMPTVGRDYSSAFLWGGAVRGKSPWPGGE
jgi:hypothetical protein